MVPVDSTASLQEETTRLLDDIANNWPEANLRAWTSADQTKAFKLGDEIKFHFHTERDCYISLIYVDSRGLLTVISPDFGDGDNFLEAGKEVTYPSEKANFQIIAEPPLGQDNVYVIATKNRAYLPEDGPYTDSYGIAKEISLALREEGKAPNVAMAKLLFMVKGRSEEIEYKTRDIVGYFKKTRALRPTLQAEQSRIYLELHVRFDFDSANLTPHAKKNLDEFGKSMLDPSLKEQRFIIAGHTDDVGSDNYNLNLSRRRAESVRNYLVSQYGINPNILLTEAYGESKPHDPRKTEAARTANRRVEFELKP
jgi:outer membrane protein OmpA-like peptidoglycan-associated protein